MGRLLVIAFVFLVLLLLIFEGAERIEPLFIPGPDESPPVAGQGASDYPPRPAALERATVVDVVDGDTVVVDRLGQEFRVRLIGINTPETRDPRRPVQCFGYQASQAATDLLEGQAVGMEADPTQSDIDRYGRLLRYLWLSDGRMANLELIEIGVASEYTYERPYNYHPYFVAAQEEARQAQRGLWSPESCDGDFDRPVIPTPSPSPARCDPAYPDVCIPSPPPDLDCGDIAARAFRVLPPDPHNFDGGNDGIGCE